MSEYSDKYNALPDDQRFMINAMLIEAEIRIIEAEKKRMLSEYRRTIKAHNARIKNMQHHLRGIKP